MSYPSMPYEHDHENEVIPFAETNFRGQSRKFGIKTDDRRRHVYVIGKTGMGKTTLLENMILSDIYAGHGVCYVDPHGDTADKILDFVPPHRVNDIVYFNPSDMEWPVGFNILEIANENQKHLVASGLMGVFKKIWPDVWSPRMEYILLNCVLALLDTPGSTLLGISRILADKDYRKKVVENVKDPVVKSFWVAEFAKYTEKFATEAIAPVQNKVGQFLSATIIRNIVAQTTSTINIREIMDSRKIFIVNLSKGLIGEDSSKLLGGMLITRLQLAAMERVDMLEKDRQDFYLYVDEFQNFATESFANILSEARKYRLNLITAHQYIEQLDETVAAAVFGNVGTIISFRVGANDAEHLAKEFAPVFVEEDIINLAKFEVYLKLMIDGVASSPFSARTLPPIAQRTESREKVVRVSRERYAVPRAEIEEKVNRWSGFDEITAATRGSSAASAGGAGPEGAVMGASERQYSASCSRCGKELKLKFPPDPTRPFYCKECLPLARAEAAKAPPPRPVSAAPTPRAPAAPAPKAPAPPPRAQRPEERKAPPKPAAAAPAGPKSGGMFGGKIRIVQEFEKEALAAAPAPAMPTAPAPAAKPVPPAAPAPAAAKPERQSAPAMTPPPVPKVPKSPAALKPQEKPPAPPEPAPSPQPPSPRPSPTEPPPAASPKKQDSEGTIAPGETIRFE